MNIYEVFNRANEVRTATEAFNILNTLTTEEIEMLFKANDLKVEGLNKSDKIEALMYYIHYVERLWIEWGKLLMSSPFLLL